MPTDEERREVAENLRTMTMCGCRYAEEFYELLSETVMNVGDFHSFNDVADRLADLIEPQQTHICLGCIKWSAIEGNPVKGVCAEFSDPEDGIERATPYYGYCHEWEDA